jgi:hypothetical protein
MCFLQLPVLIAIGVATGGVGLHARTAVVVLLASAPLLLWWAAARAAPPPAPLAQESA